MSYSKKDANSAAVAVVPAVAKYPHRIFCDLDGVMSDLAKKVDEIIGGGYSQEEYERCRKYQSMMWDAVGEWCDAGHEFWYEMDLLPNALTLWQRINYRDVTFLTATGSRVASAEDQKRRWVAKHFGTDVEVICTRTAIQKAQYAAPNHILIDDKLKAIRPWNEAGGLGILYEDEKCDECIARLDSLEFTVEDRSP